MPGFSHTVADTMPLGKVAQPVGWFRLILKLGVWVLMGFIPFYGCALPKVWIPACAGMTSARVPQYDL